MNKDNINDSFWLNDPKVLLANFDIIPNQHMTNTERLNALTRFLILVVLAMYFFGYEHSLTVLILGLLLIFVLKSNHQKENFKPRRGNHDPCHTCGFDSNMAYINTKYETTPINQYDHVNYGLRSYTNAKFKVIPPDVPAPYREVWRNEPRYCQEYSQYPKSYEIIPNNSFKYISESNYPSQKCYYEDRSWVTNTPSQQCSSGKTTAMPAVESAFMRDSMQYRNNIMGDYIDQIERTRQHNCVDFKPGRKTF